MSFFHSLKMLSKDPILGLNQAFANDKNVKKVNLGVGVYKTAEGKSLVLTCVRKAEQILIQEKRTKDYSPIDGQKTFQSLSSHLVFGQTYKPSIYAAQTVGGSGALRVGAEFLSSSLNIKKIYLPSPTWANHKPLLSSGGLYVDYYPYYNRSNHCLDFSKMCRAIEKMDERTAVVLHACCHNPTGTDLTEKQWEQVCFLIKKRKIIPFFDFAYQGLGHNLDKDAFAIRHFAKNQLEFLVAYSFSKNFGLYGERVGTLFIVSNDEKQKEVIASHIKRLIRANYSSPPIHGAQIVEKVLSCQELKKEWSYELENICCRIKEMRKSFLSSLIAKKTNHHYSFLSEQKGMFSLIDLDKDQVYRLQKEFAIYLPQDGRINIAGLNQSNLEYVVDAITTVQNS